MSGGTIVLVDKDLRAQVSPYLGEGETLSSFVTDSVHRRIEQLRREDDIATEMMNIVAEERNAGRMIDAEVVFSRLEKKVAAFRSARR